MALATELAGVKNRDPTTSATVVNSSAISRGWRSSPSSWAKPPRVIGLVVELPTRRRIFVPMLRVVSIDPRSVSLVSGTINLHRFQSRPGENLVLGALVDSVIGVERDQVGSGDHHCHLDQRVTAQIEPGHLAIDPDQKITHAISLV